MVKKDTKGNVRSPQTDFNTREILDLLERELKSFKECKPFDDNAIIAYGLKMFAHGYGHAQLLLSRPGGNS